MIDLRKAVTRHVVENPSVKAVPTKKLVRFPRFSRKFAILAGCIGCAVIIYFVSGNKLPGMPSLSTSKNKQNATTENVVATPEYATVLPTGKNIESLGGWSRVSPPDRNPVFAYSDQIGDIAINVSQQPLPKNFEDDPAKSIEDLAKSYNADKKVTVADTTAYVGTSAEGPQSVIFAKDNLLLLIKSTQKLTEKQWADYIGSLQ